MKSFNFANTLCFIGLCPSILFGAPSISDPVPDSLPSQGIAVQVREITDIPLTPRLNMIKESPDGTDRLFVIDQKGFLYVIFPDGSNSIYLNFRSYFGTDKFLWDHNQNGATSFAFHPEFAQNGKFYVICSMRLGSGDPDFLAKRPIDPSTDGTDPREPVFHDALLEFTADDSSSNLFAGSSREILRIEQPYADHNFGELTFNPNSRPGEADYGMLYAAVADGGNQFQVPLADADPENNGQDMSTIHGTIIRIDPMGTNSINGNYGVPTDNPFALSSSALPEIWSYGHRNHHRLSWDIRFKDDLYAFEMGQAMIEEINKIIPGGNYGWGDREGTFLLNEFVDAELTDLPPSEQEGTYQYPVVQYDHPNNSGAIAGGLVYRGKDIPSLYGKLIFADFTGNRGAFYSYVSDFNGLDFAETAPYYDLTIYDEGGNLSDLSTALLGSSGARRTDLRIGTDLKGEIYFLNKRNGKVFKAIPSPIEPVVEVAPNQLRIDESGGIEMLQITTEINHTWEVDILESWIHLQSPSRNTGDQTVKLEIDPLVEGQNYREGILFVAGNKISVLQGDNSLELVFPDALDLGQAYFETESLGIIYTQNWPWVYSFDLATWVMINPRSEDNGYWTFIVQ